MIHWMPKLATGFVKNIPTVEKKKGKTLRLIVKNIPTCLQQTNNAESCVQSCNLSTPSNIKGYSEKLLPFLVLGTHSFGTFFNHNLVLQ